MSEGISRVMPKMISSGDLGAASRVLVRAEQVGHGLKRRNGQGGFISLGNTRDQIKRLDAEVAKLRASLARPDLSLHQRRVKEDLLRKACAAGERLVQMLVDNYNPNPTPPLDVKVNAEDRLYPTRPKAKLYPGKPWLESKRFKRHAGEHSELVEFKSK